MDLVQNLVDEVKWRYLIGKIDKIDAESVAEAMDEVYPNEATEFCTQNKGEDLIFQVLMRI